MRYGHACNVTVIVVENGHGDRRVQIPAPLEKIWIQLISFQLWVNSKAGWVLEPLYGNMAWERITHNSNLFHLKKRMFSCHLLMCQLFVNTYVPLFSLKLIFRHLIHQWDELIYWKEKNRKKIATFTWQAAGVVVVIFVMVESTTDFSDSCHFFSVSRMDAYYRTINSLNYLKKRGQSP